MLIPLQQYSLKTPYKEYEKYFDIEIIKEDDILTPRVGNFDYLPIKAANNIPYIAARLDEALIVSGNGKIVNQNKNGTAMQFDIENIEKDTIIELPYIYYIGYNVTLNNDGNNIKLKTQESEHGFVAIQLPKATKGTINVKYTGTVVMKTSAVISIASIIGFSIYVYKSKKRWTFWEK